MSYLVDVSKLAKKEFRGEKDEKNQWTYETKLLVADILQQTQNFRTAAELTDVHINTIKVWTESDWWSEIVEKTKRIARAELNSRLTKIVDLALSRIEDRLENGDYVLNNKTGEIIRKPVSLRDANQVAKDILGQQIDIQKMEREEIKIDSSVSDILKNLATEFAKFNKTIKQNNAEDIQFVDVAATPIKES